MTRHEANSVKGSAPRTDEVWYLDSGASNHMTRHKEWFSYLEKLKNPGVVSTGDDTPHPIANVGEVPLSHVGQKGKIMNVLHILTITQNLVSIGQIVDQGMKVRFTHLGAFNKEEGRIIARGRRDGRMFILDRSDDGPDTALFAKGQNAESDIDLWHKRIGYVNYQRLQDLQTKQVVLGLPKFLKPASSGSNTDFLSPTSVIGAVISST
jgi:hypothetical protein